MMNSLGIVLKEVDFGYRKKVPIITLASRECCGSHEYYWSKLEPPPSRGACKLIFVLWPAKI
jgi:hypothetical protein